MIPFSGKFQFFIILSALIIVFILTSEWNIGMIGKQSLIVKFINIAESSDLNTTNLDKKNVNLSVEIELLNGLNAVFEEKNEESNMLVLKEGTTRSSIKVKVQSIDLVEVEETITTTTTIGTTAQRIALQLKTELLTTIEPTTIKPTTAQPTTVELSTQQPTTAQTSTITYTTPFNREKQTGLDIIRQHCEDEVVFLDELRKNDKGKCPTTGIVSAPQGGRLGNQIFEYAGVFVHAKTKGLAGYVAPCIKDRLNLIFTNLSLPTLDTIANCPIPSSTIRREGSWQFRNQSLFLYYYYQDLEVIIPHIKDLLQEFKILPSLIALADETLRNAKKKIFPNEPNVTYVGVHVRRTDYAHHLQALRGATLCNASYFFDAMTFYENKFDKIVFIYASDSPDWCTENFGNKTNAVIVSGKTTVEEDMAILAGCNHSIIDYGTYGIWGALLAGGETIVKKMRADEPSGQMPKYMSNWMAI